MALRDRIEPGAKPGRYGKDSGPVAGQRLRIERRFLLLALIVWLPLVIVLAALAYNEYTTGQRLLSVLLFKDILAHTPSGELTRLYGLMTTVSYSALLAAGLCGGLNAFVCSYSPGTNRARAFWAATAGLFVLAALDERFMFHEELGNQLHVNDALVAALYPASFLALFVWARSEVLRFRRNRWLLYIVAVAALASIVVDYFYIFDANYAYLTVIEDGTKVFASVSLFLLSLKCFLDQIHLLFEVQVRAPVP